MLKRVLKALVRFFDPRDRSCPICSATKTEHTVEHIPNGIMRDGSVVNPFTFVVDDDGNSWLLSYNRRCRVCEHLWYVAGDPGADKEWDGVRLRGPKLISVKGETERRSQYIAEHGSISLSEHFRISHEEKIKAGFYFDSELGRWLPVKTPSS